MKICAVCGGVERGNDRPSKVVCMGKCRKNFWFIDEILNPPSMEEIKKILNSEFLLDDFPPPSTELNNAVLNIVENFLKKKLQIKEVDNEK